MGVKSDKAIESCIKGIIFDFNGTLFWDSEQQELAWRSFAKEMIHREISDMEFQEYVHGRSNASIFEYLFGRPLPQAEAVELAERKEELYRQLCVDQLSFQLAPGATELLDYLKAENIPRAIATASGKTNVDFYIHHLELKRWFSYDKIIYNDGSVPGKPAPDIYIKAARAIKAAPRDCIVFEDAISGIRAADAAGIGKIIAVASKGEQKYFRNMKEIYAVISNYNEFLIYLLHR